MTRLTEVTALFPRLLPLALGGALLLAAGCEQVDPNLPAEPIGEAPRWGESFSQEAKTKQGSMLLASAADDGKPEGPVPSGPGASQKGGTAVPSKNPMAGEKWGGGDAVAGQNTFLANCAMCHGPTGKGGQRAGLTVPTLRNAGWHDLVDDNHIANTIAHGKGDMPMFVGKLSQDEINNVVAFVRTLKNTGAAAPAPKGDHPSAPKSDHPSEHPN